jgi:hypothetical protein
MKIVLLAGIAAAFAGCALGTGSVPVPPDGIYRGIYEKGFEVSSFEPCGSSERWWVTGRVQQLIAAVTSHRGLVGGTVYVELRGRVGSRGRHGHLGGYPREFIVDRVLLARRSRDTDCR